jgi:WD40 repeat protein
VVVARSGPSTELLARSDPGIPCQELHAQGERVLCLGYEGSVLVGQGGRAPAALLRGASSAAWAGDGRIAAQLDEALVFVDTDGVERARIAAAGPRVRALAARPGGGVVAALDGRLGVFDAHGRLEAELPLSSPDNLAVDPQTGVIVAQAGQTVHRWDPQGRPLPALTSPAPAGLLLAMAGDCFYVDFAHRSPDIQVLGPTEADARTLASHDANVVALAGTPEGHLLSASGDRTVRLWSPAGEELGRLPGAALSVAAGEGGRFVLSADGLQVWRRRPDSRPAPSTEQVVRIDRFPDGSVVILDAAGWVRRVDPSTGATLASAHFSRGIRAGAVWGGDLFALTDDGVVTRLDASLTSRWSVPRSPVPFDLAVGAEGVALASDDTVTLLDPASGQERGRTTVEGVDLLASDGSRVFAGTRPDSVRELLPGGGVGPAWRVPDSRARLRTLRASPGRLTVAGYLGDTFVLDAADGGVLHRWSSEGGSLDDASWSSDGRWLLTGAWDGALRLREAPSGEVRAVLPIVAAGELWAVLLASDASHAWVGAEDGTVAALDLSSLDEPADLILARVRARLGMRVVDGVITRDPAWRAPAGGG